MSETRDRMRAEPIAQPAELRDVDLVPVVPSGPPGEQGRLPGAVAGMPARRNLLRGRSWRFWLLVIVVIVPVAFAALYNGFIASDRYLSTASYIVRQTKSDASLVSMLQSQSIARVDDESHAVAEFMRSRDAVAQLNEDGFLSRVFASDAADMFGRFPTIFSGDTREDFFQHYRQYVDVEFESSTGVSVLRVEAFSPEMAQELASRLLTAAEALVNRLNERARNDAIALGREMVQDSLAHLDEIRERITRYRNEENLIDPGIEVKAASELLQVLLLETSKIDAKLAQTLASTPDSPAIEQLRIRREAIDDEIRALRQRVAGTGDGSLARKIEDYDRLVLERELAEKQLAGAVATMDTATREARGNRLYLQRIVEPSLADRAEFPHRFTNILMVLGISLLIYWIVRSLVDLLAEQT